jgi:hypothetical protein
MEAGSASTRQAAEVRPCGTCSLCCKVFEVKDVAKVAHEWCRHHVPGVGCGIHSVRPKVCRSYQCLWTTDDSLGEEWKPERSGFILHRDVSGIGLWINVDLDHVGAWRNEPYYSQIKIWSEMIRYGTGIVAVSEGDRRFVIFPEQDLPVSPGSTGAAITAGYRRRPGWRQPFARIRSKDGGEEEFVGVPLPDLR